MQSKPMTVDELIPETELARQLDLKPESLRLWRCHGKGPAFIKIGRRVFYQPADRDAWLASQRREPTAA